MSASVVDKENSLFISVARIVMIYGLVVHHLFTIPGGASFPRNGLDEYKYLIPEAISALFHMGFMTAVPMLSVISGYLFFSSKKRSYKNVVKRKVLTIVFPSVIWCAIWLLVAYVLYIVGHTRGYFEWANYHFDNFSVIYLLNGLIGYKDYPFAFQFWFIHDLVITFALYPVIERGLKYLGIWFVLICMSVWGSAIDAPIFFSTNVFFFFVIGGYIGLSNNLTLKSLYFKNYLRVLIIAGFLIVLSLRAWTSIIFQEGELIYSVIRSEYYLLFLRLVGVIAFIQIIWMVVRYRKNATSKLQKLSVYSFIIFATHYPVIEILKVIASKIPGQSTSAGVFLVWVLLPLITTAGILVSAKILNQLMPRLFNLLNGQRSLTAH